MTEGPVEWEMKIGIAQQAEPRFSDTERVEDSVLGLLEDVSRRTFQQSLL